MNPFTRSRRRRSQQILDLLAQHASGLEGIELWLETPWADRRLVAALRPLLRDGRVVSSEIPGIDPARRTRWKVGLASAEASAQVRHAPLVEPVPAEWGGPEAQWTIRVRQPDGTPVPIGDWWNKPPVGSEHEIRPRFEAMQDTNGYRKVLLRRELSAWREADDTDNED